MAGEVQKVVDERLHLSKRHGRGILRREVWVSEDGQVVRYNLAYINPVLCAHDNGRVLGYDSAHGQHHRHAMGKVTRVAFRNLAQIEARFQKEWLALVRERENAKD